MKTLAVIRKELLDTNSAVPLDEGKQYILSDKPYQCGWIKDLFVVKVDGKWHTAYSMDFDFVRSPRGLS